MVDKPDFSKIKGKFDLSSIVDNLKSMINSSNDMPDVDPNDDLGQKIVEASKLIQIMQEQHKTHEKNVAELGNLLAMIFKDAEALRAENATLRAGSTPPEVRAPEVKAPESPAPETKTPEDQT